MRIVRHEEEPITLDGDTAIDSAAGIADQTLCARPAVLPDRSSGARIQRVDFVRFGHVHHAVHHYRSHFQKTRPWQRIHPFHAQTPHVVRTNLIERAVAVSGEFAIVSGPITATGQVHFAP